MSRIGSFVRVVAVAASIFVVGCSSSHSSSSSTSTSSPGRSFSVNTPEGSVSVSLDGQLPPGWPSAFPVPSGATPAGSGSIGGSNQSHMVAVFNASGSGQAAFDFYKNNSALTVSNAKSAGTGSGFVGRMNVTGTYSGSVTVTQYSGKTYIVVYLKS
jgi:hypothetical protein